jgi:branched-chain amino acid aminotransferase
MHLLFILPHLQDLEECVKVLLRLDRAWLPDRPGHSMYIRPFMFSSDGALGVSPSRATTLSVILSPVGPYFKSGADSAGSWWLCGGKFVMCCSE